MYHGIKEKVRELRQAGKMYSEIRQILNLQLPKSTLCTWCKGIILDAKAQARIDEKVKNTLIESRIKAWASLANKRKKYIENIFGTNKKLANKLKDNEVAKIALAMLYLGEGSKTNRGAVMFGNSEPNIVALFMALLRQCYKIDESKFRFTLQCRADQDVNKLESFWLKLTGIPRSQCFKVQIDPRTKGKPSKKQNYKGVCRIDYFSAHIDNELKIIVKLINNYYKLNFGPVV